MSERENSRMRCLGCMDAFDRAFTFCPHCGYEAGTPAENLLQLEPGSVLENRYLIGRSLGYGSFGITYIAWDGKLQRKVAIKEFLPSQFATRQIHHQPLKITDEQKHQQQFESGKKKFLEEGRKLSHMNGIDGVVHMYDCFEANNTAYIVMEYLRGETLAALLEREGSLTEQQTKELAVPLLQALQEVHSKGIIHRDIAPDNIFLARDDEDRLTVKLIDFGSARFSTTSYSKSLTMIIKPGYSPEEQYRSEGQQGTYTDVYALAAVLYKAATGVRPPAADKRRLEIATNRRDPLQAPRKLKKELSENFETALLNALNVRIEDRTATADEFLEELISFEPVERRGSTIKRIDFFKWPLWAQIGVPLASLAALGLLVYFIIFKLIPWPIEYKLPEGMTRVPDFVTMTQEEARERAAKAHLVLEEGGREYAPGVMSDLVLRQSTQSGEIVDENQVVRVIISTEEEHYPIPDVTGMPLDAARFAMECTGLAVETTEVQIPGLAKDCVASQDLEPFTMSEPGKVVTLSVNTIGAGRAGTAPNLTGLLYADALTAAEQAGAVVSVKERIFSADEPNGKILSQSIPAGAELKEGDVIELTAAIPWREFEMPNLLYKDQETAQQLLRNIGLKTVIQEEPNEALVKGLVAAQDVESDAPVKPGDTVTLHVSSGGKPVAIPDVLGMSEKDAREALSGVSMIVRVEYDYDASVKEGSVISQSIAGGEEAQRGTAVTIVVCSTEGLIKVANVVGMTSEAARNTLKQQGLDVLINENYNDSVPKGTVAAQIPAADSVQKPNTTIVITVSKGPAPAAPTPAPAVQTANPAVPTTAPVAPTPVGPTPTPKPTPKPTPSDWVTSLPAGVDSSRYIIEQRTQYCYHYYERRESESSSMSGWNRISSYPKWGDWGATGAWQDTRLSTGDTRREAGSRTVYAYYWFECPNCHQHMHCWDVTCPTWADGCGKAYIPESSWHLLWSTTPHSSVSFSEFHGTGHYIAYVDGVRVFKWTDGMQRGEATKTQYCYQERSQITVYVYEKETRCSDWSFNRESVNDTKREEIRTVYRYTPR